MGWFDRLTRLPDPVDGTAQVVSVTRPPDGHGSAACGMHLVVAVPGVQPFAVERTMIVKMRNWPRVGSVLPITASRSDPQRFKVRWDDVASNEAIAAATAARLAASMGAAGPNGPPAPPWASTGEVTVNGRAVTGAERDQLLGMIGDALDGAAPAAATDDRVGQLERLAALHRAGALTDDEFAREKARLLG